MKVGKMINLLDSIPKFNLYSHYGACLDKIFKKNSLKNFIETLKFQEEYKRKFLPKGEFLMPSYIEDKEKEINKNESKNNSISSQKIIKCKKNKEKIDDIFSVNYIPKPKKIHEINKTKNNSTFFYGRNSAKTIENPDPFRYSPNYNSISKNIPFFKMYKPISFKKSKEKIIVGKLKKIKKNISKIDSSNLLKHERNNDKIGEKFISRTKTIITSKKNFSPVLLTEVNLFKKKIYKNIMINKTTNEKSQRKNNHHFSNISNIYKTNKKVGKLQLPDSLIESDLQKFDTFYPVKSRKMSKNIIKGKILKLKNKNTSFYNRNKAIDFNKMQSHSFKTLLNNNCLTTPNSGYYNPKYDLIEENPRNIYFSKKPVDKLKSKKLKLNHILTSYNTKSEYSIIDNTKLNDKIF